MRKSLVMLMVLALLLGGCSFGKTPQPAPAPAPTPAPTPTPPPQPPTTPPKIALTLYFPDNMAEKLLEEKREVSQSGVSLPQLIVDQLIVGPVTNKNAVSLIPKGTKAKVTQEADLATVDFSAEIKQANLGSSGEALLINSLLASLFQIPSVQRVQILIEGKKTETLAGHMDISKPLSRR